MALNNFLPKPLSPSLKLPKSVLPLLPNLMRTILLLVLRHSLRTLPISKQVITVQLQVQKRIKMRALQGRLYGGKLQLMLVMLKRGFQRK